MTTKQDRGIFAGVQKRRSNTALRGLFRGMDDQPTYDGCCGVDDDPVFGGIDDDSRAAALAQAKQTGQSVTITLSDGSTFTAGPSGFTSTVMASSATGPSARDLAVSGLLSVGLGVGGALLGKRWKAHPVAGGIGGFLLGSGVGANVGMLITGKRLLG